MATVNIADQINNILIAEVLEGGDSEIKQLKADIEKLIRQENEKFFSLLVLKGIGVRARPNFGRFTPPVWQKLSEQYAARKKKLGVSGFYLLSGDLRRDLLSLDSKGLLGSPKAVLKQVGEARGSLGVSPFGVQGRSAITGRFARRSDIFREVKIEISINPIPNLPEGADEDNLFGAHPLIHKKFGSEKVRGKRPLIKHFIDWWVGVHLDGIIRQRFQ